MQIDVPAIIISSGASAPHHKCVRILRVQAGDEDGESTEGEVGVPKLPQRLVWLVTATPNVVAASQ